MSQRKRENTNEGNPEIPNREVSVSDGQNVKQQQPSSSSAELVALERACDAVESSTGEIFIKKTTPKTKTQEWASLAAATLFTAAATHWQAEKLIREQTKSLSENKGNSVLGHSGQRPFNWPFFVARFAKEIFGLGWQVAFMEGMNRQLQNKNLSDEQRSALSLAVGIPAANLLLSPLNSMIYDCASPSNEQALSRLKSSFKKLLQQNYYSYLKPALWDTARQAGSIPLTFVIKEGARREVEAILDEHGKITKMTVTIGVSAAANAAIGPIFTPFAIIAAQQRVNPTWSHWETIFNIYKANGWKGFYKGAAMGSKLGAQGVTVWLVADYSIESLTDFLNEFFDEVDNVEQYVATQQHMTADDDSSCKVQTSTPLRQTQMNAEKKFTPEEEQNDEQKARSHCVMM